MIEKFIDSVLIIDDKEAEIINLKNLLEKKEIWVKHHLPEDLKKRTTPLKYSKLIFLDLHLEEDKSPIVNIGIIRSLFQKVIGKEYGSYGIVLWSKHTDEIDELKKRMGNDGDSYSLPLFIIGVDKTKYIQQNNYDNLLTDIDTALHHDVASNFFMYWDSLVDKGKYHSIKSIYSLVKNYTNLQEDLQFILHKLALNYTGIPLGSIENYKLEIDAIKAIADMLHYEIIHQHDGDLDLFKVGEVINFSGTPEEQKNVFASLNSKLFLDFKNIDQSKVIPGNVYQILEDNSFFGITNAPQGATKILVEVTPPCDFAVDKKADRSRVLGGFFINELSNGQKSTFGKEHYYKELDGLIFEGEPAPKYLRFDFRYFGSVTENDLKDVVKYKLLFRFKDKLFADILQKLASHTARLGLPFIK